MSTGLQVQQPAIGSGQHMTCEAKLENEAIAHTPAVLSDSELGGSWGALVTSTHVLKSFRDFKPFRRTASRRN